MDETNHLLSVCRGFPTDVEGARAVAGARWNGLRKSERVGEWQLDLEAEYDLSTRNYVCAATLLNVDRALCFHATRRIPRRKVEMALSARKVAAAFREQFDACLAQLAADIFHYDRRFREWAVQSTTLTIGA
jgi:hypothetical protein